MKAILFFANDMLKVAEIRLRNAKLRKKPCFSKQFFSKDKTKQ